jgi:hypothetical protein
MSFYRGLLRLLAVLWIGDAEGRRYWAVPPDSAKVEGESICILKKVWEFLESGLTGMEVWLQSSARR